MMLGCFLCLYVRQTSARGEILLIYFLRFSIRYNFRNTILFLLVRLATTEL